MAAAERLKTKLLDAARRGDQVSQLGPPPVGVVRGKSCTVSTNYLPSVASHGYVPCI